ncbi:hypothetical protein [Limisalsivibrio acetivorans]|uniref:hypothetical protein n=1 Tax=Limisalsivibrio acetivorans TaxID=1304888 RepID=UPI0003B5130F|nr:hypothetical protein [Limisalsivibrio acetivorans]
MEIVDGILKVSPSMEFNDIKELGAFLMEHIDEIKLVELDKEPLENSALLSILLAFKKESGNVSIPVLEGEQVRLEGVGRMAVRY